MNPTTNHFTADQQSPTTTTKKKERGGKKAGKGGANNPQTTLPSMPGGGIRFGPLLVLAVNG